MKNYTVIRSETLSKGYDSRFVVVDNVSGEILDDAQGYGYRTPQKAHAAWAYKTRDRSKDAEKRKKKQHIKDWMREHKSFVRELEGYAFEIAKGSWGPDDKVDAKFVKQLLNERGLEPDFTAGEFLKVWRS